MLTVHWPTRAPELYQYLAHMMNLAHLHDFDLVYNYDMQFRWQVESNSKKSWAIIDNIILSSEIISPSMSIARKSKESPSKWNKGKPKETCRKFNSGRCNFGGRCRYLHKCFKCQKFGHGAKDCKVKDKWGGKQDMNSN